MTPPIPEFIRNIRHPNYRNVFEYQLGNSNLWGTESLLGDWNGEFLLIAKDFYPSSYVEAGISNGVTNPYQHNPAAPTNRNLIRTLKCFRRYSDGAPSTESNFLYVSACFLLRGDGVVRGPLPDERNVLRLSWPVLEFTISHMPRLRHVVLMGAQAANAIQCTPLKETIAGRGLQLTTVRHPAYAMTEADRIVDWARVFGEPNAQSILREY